VRIWDPVTGAQAGWFSHDHGWIRSMAGLSGARPLLALGGPDSTAGIWDPATGTRLHELPGTDDWWGSMAALPALDGRTLLVTADRRTPVRLWDPQTGTLIQELPSATTDARALMTIPRADAQALLAIALPTGDVHIHDPVTGVRLHAITATGVSRAWESPMAMSTAPDGRTLLVAAVGGPRVGVWDPFTGRAVADIDVMMPVEQVAPTEGGLVVAGGEGMVTLDLLPALRR
jgi:WD40 repeat protein